MGTYLSSVGVSDVPPITHGQVLCPPTLRPLPCLIEWWSICLVGQARNWESPFTPPSGLPPWPLPSPQPASFTSEMSLESVQFSPSPSQPPQSWFPAVFSLSLVIASSVRWFWSSSSPPSTLQPADLEPSSLKPFKVSLKNDYCF